jgi:hypothetical protein
VLDRLDPIFYQENLEMNKIVDLRRIWIFLAFAFGLAWVIDLVIYLTGGLTRLGGVGTLAWMLLVVTLVASIPFTILAFWLLWRADVFAQNEFAPSVATRLAHPVNS